MISPDASRPDDVHCGDYQRDDNGPTNTPATDPTPRSLASTGSIESFDPTFISAQDLLPDEEATDTRTCTACGTTRSVTRFARKRKGRSTRCKSCQQEYFKAYYACNGDEVRRKAKAYRKVVIPQRRAQVQEVRLRQHCCVCTTSEDLRAFRDGRSPSVMVRNSNAPDQLEKALEDCDWYCTRCVGSLVGRSHPLDLHHDPLANFLAHQLREGAMGEVELRDILELQVPAVHNAPPSLIQERLERLVTSSVVRLDAGLYTLAGERHRS